jgi:asparagine synthase (glutamine-hydrolysing)
VGDRDGTHGYARRVCGIGGTAGEPPDSRLLQRMAATMAKRGPDGERTWHDEAVGFAFRRLAVIDLHERSGQPQHLGSLHLVFNGEIYNYRELRHDLRGRGHRFQTEGDAEVLLHAWQEWGDGALDRLNGMFALAVWDDAQRTLTLASDLFGEKPLYYARLGAGLVWASEIKALLEHPDVLGTSDDGALVAFVARGVLPPTDGSFYAGIRRLPAAHLLVWRDGVAEVRRYWRPQRVDVPKRFDEAAAALRELLVDSIRLRLRSDVPVGTSLSGGLDSATVVMLSAGLAGDHTRHAFTATFPGFDRDEWRYAAEVAHAAGVTAHHAVEPTAEEALADLEPFVIDHEEPVEGLSVYAQWRVMRAAREAGVTVLLDGQGGDELFAGYPGSSAYAIRQLPLGDVLREVRADRSHVAGVGRSLAADYLPEWLRRIARRSESSPYASAEAVLEASRTPPLNGTGWRDEHRPQRRHLLTQSLESSLPVLLRYADRSSMASSREVRLPLLDRRVAELAWSLPADFVYSQGISKRILREAGRGVVPGSIRRRRDKVGFEPPQRPWLDTASFRRLIGELLLDGDALGRSLYETRAIEADLRAGSWRDATGIWRAVNAEIWLRTMVRTPVGVKFEP